MNERGLAVLLRNLNADLPLYDEMRIVTLASRNLHVNKTYTDLSFKLSNNTAKGPIHNLILVLFIFPDNIETLHKSNFYYRPVYPEIRIKPAFGPETFFIITAGLFLKHLVKAVIPV